MKSKSVRNSVVAGLLAVAAAGYSLQAVAVPVVFSFHQSAGFVVDEGTLRSTSAVNSGFNANNLAPTNSIVWYEHSSGVAPPISGPFGITQTFDTIAWGLPSLGGGGKRLSDPFLAGSDSSTRYSGLRVTGLESATALQTADVSTDWGDFVSITRIFHRNMPIAAAAKTLTEAVIWSKLTFDHAPEGDLNTSGNFIAFKFKETPNQPANGICADGNPAGNAVLGKPKCDDLFGFSSAGFDPVTFSYGGHNYEVGFALGNFASSATDFNDGCPSNNDPFGPGYECTVWTAEGKTSSLDVLARVRQIREVPEPSTLALLGLSLLGVAGLRRRRTAVAEV